MLLWLNNLGGSGGINPAVRRCGCSPYNDASKYDDGEPYCDSRFTLRSYEAALEATGHYVSAKISAVGYALTIHSLYLLTQPKNRQQYNYEAITDEHRFTRMSVTVTHRGSCIKINGMRPLVNIRRMRSRGVNEE